MIKLNFKKIILLLLIFLMIFTTLVNADNEITPTENR